MINKEHLEKLRREYLQKGFYEKDAAANPYLQFSLWFNEALELGLIDANAMALATASKDGRPSNRIVLLKSFDETGFIFFTNYKSRKGKELLQNPFASLLFYWEEISRQVRVEGIVEKISVSESALYFQSRPVESRLSAWASEQSSIIENREELEKKYFELEKHYAEQVIPLPEHWGGYRVIPDAIEFWQGRPGRMHDRILYIKEVNEWKIKRLAP
jgi:pyridoxamine 5'-phosphate oxidase